MDKLGRSISRQGGAVNILLIPFILISVFFIAAAGFGYWSYGNELSAKQDLDAKANQQIVAARQILSTKLNSDFTTQQNDPYGTYTSPSDSGSIKIKYPRDWAVYASETNNSSTPVDAYFYPNFVPDIQNTANNFAMRLRVTSQSLSSMVQQYQSNVTQGTLKMTTYRPPNIPNSTGYIMTGQILQQKSGTMIMVGLRDKTVQFWTESDQFLNEFNTIGLPNFTFNR